MGELQPEPESAAALHDRLPSGVTDPRAGLPGPSAATRGRPVLPVPQDSVFNVRGVRNTPCITKPGKRAPTAKMCNSDEQYRPLNEGDNWKGDPNATLSGQDIPQYPPGTSAPPAPTVAAPAPPPIVTATYDPATGNYVGPDGRLYTQADLADAARTDRTWQSMLLPPPGS